MTYAEAQASLIALGRSLSLTGLEGRSLTGLLQEIVVASNPPTDTCVGSDFDNALRDALGITP